MTNSNHQPPKMSHSPFRFSSPNDTQNQAQIPTPIPRCSRSYITHQRRPAIIPAGVHLSPEDEQAVRMRTGCVNPLSQNELAFAVPRHHPDAHAHAHAPKFNSPADVPMTGHKLQMTSGAEMGRRGWNGMSEDTTREHDAWAKMQEQKDKEWLYKIKEKKEKILREGESGLVGIAGPGGRIVINNGYGKRKASEQLDEEESSQ